MKCEFNSINYIESDNKTIMDRDITSSESESLFIRSSYKSFFFWWSCVTASQKKSGTVNNWCVHQVTLQPRSGPSGASVPSPVAKAGKWGRDLASPHPTGRCAAALCGKRACATTQLPVRGNMGSQAQVCLCCPPALPEVSGWLMMFSQSK